MNGLVQALQSAADRGVQVTIITGPATDPYAAPSRFRWRWRDTAFAADGQFQAAGYDVRVTDCDGDFSCWSIKRAGQLLAQGEAHDGYPYHCDVCVAAAEAALLHLVRARKADLRGRA